MVPNDVVTVQIEVVEEVKSEVVEVERANGEVEEEAKVYEVWAQKKERDKIVEKHLKLKALLANFVGHPSKRQWQGEGVYFYPMDIGEHLPPLIVSYSKSVSFNVAYEGLCIDEMRLWMYF